jgi:hypothetical protein
LLLHGSRTTEELLSGVPFPQRYGKAAPSEFRVRRGLLRQNSRTTLRNPVFSYKDSCDEIALRKILLLGGIQG